MRTLPPAQTFLRVVDKFFAAFALEDQNLSAGATLLYLNLFRLAGHRDACAPSQATLARACKSSERSVQLYLRKLVSLGYIRIEREGTRNVYRLLFSDHVRELAGMIGIDLAYGKDADSSPLNPQKAVCKGADFSHSLREKNIKHIKQNIPLSPSSVQPPTPLAPPPRKNPPCQGGCVSVRKIGEGDSSSRSFRTSNPTPLSSPGKAGDVLPAASGKDLDPDFERLFTAWPLKKDKLNASRVFASLKRSGCLPPMDELLATVERFKAEDRSWRNGYVPNLRFWLQGQRWTDDITPVVDVPSRASTSMASTPMPFADPAMQDVAAQACLAAKVRAVQENCHARREEGSELASAVDKFAQLWPDEPRQKLFSRLVSAAMRGVSLPDMTRRALDWRGTLPPVGEWFSAAVA